MDFRVVGAGVYAVKVLKTWILQTEGNPFVTLHPVDLEGFRVHFSSSALLGIDVRHQTFREKELYPQNHAALSTILSRSWY